MLIPKGGAPNEIVINQCVLQQVVTHVESVYGLTTDGQVRGGAELPLILEQLQASSMTSVGRGLAGQRPDGTPRGEATVNALLDAAPVPGA